MTEAHPNDEDTFAAKLAAYDAALAEGRPSVEETPEDEELRRAKTCLDKLEAIWPRRARNSSSNASGKGVGNLLPERPAGCPTQKTPDPFSTRLGEPLPQTELGRFQLVRELGCGGGGIVYLAYDPMLHRQVALKVPRPESLFTKELRRRFVREAEVAAQLNHRNINPVYEAGEAGGVCYLVSAYCPGPNLARWMSGRSVAPRQAAMIVAALCDGVTHMHRRSILHRDIKPTNVLLDFDEFIVPHSGGKGESAGMGPAEAGTSNVSQLEFVPRLTDFGLAKLDAPVENGLGAVPNAAFPNAGGAETAKRQGGRSLQKADEEAERESSEATDRHDGRSHGETMTRTGAIIGTPAYMAPEQAEGRLDLVGPATDVYALGVVLYELLAGRPPFRGATNVVTLRQVVSEEPPAVRRCRRDVPSDLETICLKCLAKQPADRYATAAELAGDLSNFLEGKPTVARPLPIVQRAIKWTRRRPMAAALAATVSLVLLLLIGGSGWYAIAKDRHNTELTRINDKLSDTAQRERENSLALEKALTRAEGSDWLVRNQFYASQIRTAWHLQQAGRLGSMRELVHTLRPDPERQDLRDFEWHYLRRLGGRDLVLQDDSDRITALAYSQDGQLCAAGSSDGKITVWNLEADKPISTLSGHDTPIIDLRFTAKDTRLVSAGWCLAAGEDIMRGDLRVWDLSTGKTILERGPYRHAGKSGVRLRMQLARNAPIAIVVLAGEGGGILSVNLDTGEERKLLARDTIWNAALSPQADLIAIAERYRVELVDVAGSQSRGFIGAVENGGISGVEFSANGKSLVFGIALGKYCVQIWDVESGVQLHELTTKHLPARFAFDASEKWFAATDIDSSRGGETTFYLWDLHAGTLVDSKEDGVVDAMAFSPSGRELAVGGRDGVVRLPETEGEGESYLLPGPGPKSEAWCVGFAPDGSLAVSYDHDAGSDSETLKVWDLATRQAKTLSGHRAMVMALAWNKTDATLATASHDRTVRIWNRLTGNSRGEMTEHTAPVRAVAFSPDGTLLASAGSDRTITLRNLAAGTTLTHRQAHTDTIRTLSFSADGRYLVSGGNDHQIKIWNAADLSLVRSISDSFQVQTVCCAPQGTWLASGNEGDEVKVWDLETGAQVRSFLGHTGKVRSVTFSPNGRTLASGGEDKTVRLWQVLTGQELLELPCEHFVNGLAFDSEGKILAAALHDGHVKIWPAK